VEIPQAYLLCGPAGSGKTTYAEGLVLQGMVRLSIDESMDQRYGQAGVDYPVEEYPARENEVMEEHRVRLSGLLAVGESVVLDYGFPTRGERASYKKFVEEHGGQWRLLYFLATPELLRDRLRARNARNDANAQPVSEELLDRLLARFQVPVNEGEEVILAA
jgi:predicted kinase